MSRFVETILAEEASARDRSFEHLAEGLGASQLWGECLALDSFRRREENLYMRVRALFFLYAICRFALPPKLESQRAGLIPASVHGHLMDRRFQEAIDELFVSCGKALPDDALCSAFAQAFYQLALQNLADQVRRSVRSVRGNQWMFRCGHPSTHPLRVRPELTGRTDGAPFPILHERTAVRMDLSHSSWSDIFFLGMDFPEGARVLNVSIDLALDGSSTEPEPPVAAIFRIIDEPVIRLTSIDLGASADITELGDIFNFSKDYLGLLKAAAIASGLVPIGMEGSGTRLSELLERLVGPGRGFELASSVNNIPKGSRLAVSTNLLGALIAACMRATGQTGSLTGPLAEEDRRIVAARAILGEWLGGSGGGWQDSGGVWPGIKVIAGCAAGEGDPEFEISRGRLLPTHKILGMEEVSLESRRRLQESLVLVHGGMAQNVGPILEMVTEKYLLRSRAEWAARAESMDMFDKILDALRAGDMRELGGLTTRHFFGPLQAIIPWATNKFTERVISDVREEFGQDFWGFWMLGGMSGGGMGFIFDPARAPEARRQMQVILSRAKADLERALPFAMEPVVYQFAVNESGSCAQLRTGPDAMMPPAYYPLMVPAILRADPRTLPPARLAEAKLYGSRASTDEKLRQTIAPLLRNLLPHDENQSGTGSSSLDDMLKNYGFDPEAHERIRSDLRAGLTGLAQNRLPASTVIEDISPREIFDLVRDASGGDIAVGAAALSAGEVAVVSLAAGAGSRWTEGAGVVKALHPFCKLAGRHRNFIETHLAKSARTAKEFGTAPAHVFTTSYLTHRPIESVLEAEAHYAYPGPLMLSFGRSIGLRLIPMVRDLRFAYEEVRHQVLDERKEKMRESIQQALIGWASRAGEGCDYRDNLPAQCLHPVGHWFEVPNLLLNGTLEKLLRERPATRTLLLHNIDTVGVNLDPAALGLHRRGGATLTFEVISRRLDDRGGGLAKIDGRPRLVEGLALPREEDEYKLTYYNTLSTWIEIDPLLALFGLDRGMLSAPSAVARAVRTFAARLPTYITLKDVKKRWGHGHEDIFPVAQFEKLWGDMTALHDVPSTFVAVPRLRGQQLKAQAQLDGWLRDGSAAHVESLGLWG